MAVDNVLSVASRQASWLLARQNVVAENVANANTPAYRSVDLKPFDAALQATALQLARTSPKHMSIVQNNYEPTLDDPNSENHETYLSGNDVSLEREMEKGGEITRAYSLNTGIAKVFNGMILSAAKA
jgi:flagellar basal-body rod protein FlgB